MTGLTLAEVDADHTPRCCAKCARGTRAMPGPCAYDMKCPNPNCQHPAHAADEAGTYR